MPVMVGGSSNLLYPNITHDNPPFVKCTTVPRYCISNISRTQEPILDRVHQPVVLEHVSRGGAAAEPHEKSKSRILLTRGCRIEGITGCPDVHVAWAGVSVRGSAGSGNI